MLLLSKRSNLLRFSLALGFLLGVTTTIGLFFNDGTVPLPLILAVLFGGYMAITIGANDAANNLGAAVGSKALTLTSALIIAIVFGSAGALIAGGDVMNTIKGEIINPALIRNQEDFVWLMLSALLAAALWIHLATAFGAPVSTTHSIIGGIVGAGITVGGLGIANWSKIAAIASSWIISPLLGGLIAAAFLYLIKNTLTYRENMSRAAIRVVPILVAAMAWAFSAYLILKGFKQIWQVDFITAILTSLVIAVGLYLIIQPAIAQAADRLPQSKIGINRLFNIPLFFAAALLSFAHGANDVANVVGPVAAIHEVMLGFGVSELTSIPLWIMLIGVSGLALGLVLYGPKLIKVIGSEITELDQIRAYCIVMAVSITIILASEFSIPVSSTHITVGAIFGVGFLREYLKSHHAETREKITRHLEGKKLSLIHHFMDEFYLASLPEKRKMLKQLEIHSSAPELSKKERKELHKLYRQELVKRSTFLKIIIAWLITLPIAGFFASLIYLLIQVIK